MSKVTQTKLFGGTVTATGNGAVYGFGAQNAVFVLDITAASGTTPTITVLVEEYDETSNSYATVDTFPAQTGVARVRRTVVGNTTPFGNKLRVSWTVGGTTPSFTFTVSAHDKP